MIDFDTLSHEEKKAMEELRRRVESEFDSDLKKDSSLCYRFLKARDFNIDKAEKMLRKHIIWRRAKQISTIAEDFVPAEVFMKYLVPSCIGVDKKDDLLLYYPLGKLDGREANKCFILNNFMDSWEWYCEKCFALIKQLNEKRGDAGRTFSQISGIVDLDKLTFSNATSKASTENMLRFMQIIQDNYPEGMSDLFVINAPRYYAFIFSILKTLMSNATIQKISVFGHDGWKNALLNAIDADVLPAFLGGNRTDPDGNPLCKTFVSHGGTLPSFYILSEEDRYFTDKNHVTTIFVPKSGQKEVYVDVEEEGSVIQWKFLAKNKDIGFGLFHGNLERTEVLPVLRYGTPDGTVKGSYKTKVTGKYIILFDNSYSWLNSKEVDYNIQITNSNQ